MSATTLPVVRRHVGTVLVLSWVTVLLLIALHAFGVAQRATVSHAPAADRGQAQGLPPYWNVQAPEWCNEDQVCWIGSDADGRSDAESLADWNEQLVRLAG